MLDARNHQGKFGRPTFVCSLRLACWYIRLTWTTTESILNPMARPGRRGGLTAIDVQVKSWSSPRRSAAAYNFNGLNEKQFNKLAGQFTVPRYLFLVVVPRSVAAYSEVLTDGMLLRYQAFYVSLGAKTQLKSRAGSGAVSFRFQSQTFLRQVRCQVLQLRFHGECLAALLS